MAKVLRESVTRFFKNLVTDWLEDLLIFIGILIVLITTYQKFGYTVGNYSLGVVLLLCGLLLARR